MPGERKTWMGWPGGGRLGLALLVVCAAACRLDEVHAILPPGDAGGGDDGHTGSDGAVTSHDAGPSPDAALCMAGADADGDGMDDCSELGDGDPYTDPNVFNGFTAVIGDRPEVTGNCSNVGDFTTMTGHFTGTTRMNVYAGWEFDTSADAYNDPSYGFQPNWLSAPSERFSVRYSGKMKVPQTGMYCFSVDIGATGTGIVTGKNMCAKLWLNGGTGAGQSPTALLESGYGASSDTANQACLSLTAGETTVDLVFWYFNILEQAKLQVRHCFGGTTTCTPDQPIAARELHAAQ